MHGAAQKAIGKRIKEYREKCGLTQEMLAEKTDLTPNYISAVERGISFPRFEKLIAIINAIGASADQIFADVKHGGNALLRPLQGNRAAPVPRTAAHLRRGGNHDRRGKKGIKNTRRACALRV